MAVGRPAAGVSGFRDSRATAQRVRELMQLRLDSAAVTVNWNEVAWLGLITAPAPDVRRQIKASLGRLGEAGERTEALRNTLLTYLELNRSLAATADALHVHRNTVRYRVAQALELLDRPLDGNVFDLLAALHAARWLDPAIS